MSTAVRPLRARARAAWRALRGVYEAPPPRRVVHIRPAGYPQRIRQYAGYLAGGDHDPALERLAKYELYREMLDGDPIVQHGRLLIDGPVLSAEWMIDPPKGASRELADRVERMLFQCPHEQAMPWREQLQHFQLAAWLGCYLFERVWFVDEDGTDGVYLSPRPPDTMRRWWLDGRRIKQVEQYVYNDPVSNEPSSIFAIIEGDDILHIAFDQEGNNIEGRSLLRSWRADFTSKREARISRDIMLERAQGVPYAEPTGEALVDGDVDAIEETLRDWVNHEQMYLIGSRGYKLTPFQLTLDGIEHCNAAIEYSDKVLLQRLLLTFMLQGMLPSGSRSVADVQERPFWQSMGVWADMIVERYQTGVIAPYVRDNFGDTAAKEAPKLVYRGLKSTTIDEELEPILETLKSMPGLGRLRAVQERVLDVLGMPEATVDEVSETPSTLPTDEAMGAQFAGEPIGGWTVDSSSPHAAAGRLARVPRGAEVYVAFEALAVAWDDAEAEARAILEQLRARLIQALQERIQGYTGDPLDSKALTAYLERYKAAWTDEARRKITGLGVSEFGRGRSDVAEELARQPRPPASSKARLIARRQADVAAPSAAGTSKAAIDALVARGLDEYRAGLIREAVTEAVGQAANSGSVTNLAAVRDRMTALSQNAVTGSIRNGISRGYNSGRLNEAVKGGAGYATFSTLLEDGQTCDACAAHENEVVLVGSAEFESLQPPYVDCYSTLSASGRNRCRCIFVYSGVDPVAFEEAA